MDVELVLLDKAKMEFYKNKPHTRNINVSEPHTRNINVSEPHSVNDLCECE